MPTSRVLLAALLPAALLAQAPTSLPRKAERLYLDLRREGLQSFEADVDPDWAHLLREQKAPNSEEAAKLLGGIHFHVVLDAQGVAHVTHHTDTVAPNAQAEEGFKQIYSGMEQMLVGFFQTWGAFMLNSPFPKDGVPFKVEAREDLQHLTYKDGSSDIHLVLAPGLRLQNVLVSTADFESSIQPDFAATDKGLCMSGYRAEYRPLSGPGATKLEVQITSLPVQGLPLPETLGLRGSYDGVPFNVRLNFKGHQVVKGPAKAPATK